MKSTTASGSSFAACVDESWPQSTRPELEIPVARWGSRVTSTAAPWSANLRAVSMSSGVDRESPVTSSRLSAWGMLVGREPGGEIATRFGERELVRDPAGRPPDGLDDVPPDTRVELVRRLAHRATGEDQEKERGQHHRLHRVRGREPAQVPTVEALHQAVVAVRLSLAPGAGLCLHLGDRLEVLRDEDRLNTGCAVAQPRIIAWS